MSQFTEREKMFTTLSNIGESQDRRRFLGAAAAILLASQVKDAMAAQEAPGSSVGPKTNSPLPSIRQIRAGELDVGYVE